MSNWANFPTVSTAMQTALNNAYDHIELCIGNVPTDKTLNNYPDALLSVLSNYLVNKVTCLTTDGHQFIDAGVTPSLPNFAIQLDMSVDAYSSSGFTNIFSARGNKGANPWSLFANAGQFRCDYVTADSSNSGALTLGTRFKVKVDNNVYSKDGTTFRTRTPSSTYTAGSRLWLFVAQNANTVVAGSEHCGNVHAYDVKIWNGASRDILIKHFVPVVAIADIPAAKSYTGDVIASGTAGFWEMCGDKFYKSRGSQGFGYVS